MKRIRAISAVTVIAALSLTGQAFAFGGGMGGGQGGGSMAGGHQMTSSRSMTNGGMHQGTGQAGMKQQGPGKGGTMQQGAMNGAVPQDMATNGTGGGMTAAQAPATQTTK